MDLEDTIALAKAILAYAEPIGLSGKSRAIELMRQGRVLPVRINGQYRFADPTRRSRYASINLPKSSDTP